MILRSLAAVLLLLGMLGGIAYAGYLLGARRGRALVRRWQRLIEAAMEWRQLELQGDETAAQVQLDAVRRLVDAEEDRLQRFVRELE